MTLVAALLFRYRDQQGRRESTPYLDSIHAAFPHGDRKTRAGATL